MWLLPPGLSLCVPGCPVCAQQGQAPLAGLSSQAALHSRYNRELSTLPQSSRTKALANQIWAFLLSWAFKGTLYTNTDYIQHLACLCLCFFKKSEVLFLVKPTVSYRRYWDIKPRALHNEQIYLSNKGGVVGKEKENTSIWQLTS